MALRSCDSNKIITLEIIPKRLEKFFQIHRVRELYFEYDSLGYVCIGRSGKEIRHIDHFIAPLTSYMLECFHNEKLRVVMDDTCRLEIGKCQRNSTTYGIPPYYRAV